MNDTPNLMTHERIMSGEEYVSYSDYLLLKEKYDTLAVENMLEVNKLCKERDEAREQAQRLRVENNHNWQANEMAEQSFRERNEAHKIAERAIDDLAWFSETNAQRLRAELDQIKEGAK